MECQGLKAAVRQALGRGTPAEELRPLRRAFNALIRGKRRAFQRRRLEELLGELRDTPKQYWDAFLVQPKRLPEGLRHPAVWTNAMRQALNPPCPEPTGDAIMEGSPPPGDGAELLGPITRGEVVSAFVGPQTYKAAGTSGRPTELSKCAFVAQRSGEPPPPPDVDVPQHLAVTLSACFASGHVPSWWNRGLVSPLWK